MTDVRVYRRAERITAHDFEPDIDSEDIGGVLRFAVDAMAENGSPMADGDVVEVWDGAFPVGSWEKQGDRWSKHEEVK